MTPYLIQLLRELRNERGIPLVDLTAPVGLRESNLSRFERGGHSYFARLDNIVEGYADALGLKPLDVWRQALERAEDAERLGVEKARKRGRAAVTRRRK